jgi:2-keto-4-pentenoate hydratase
VTRRGVEFNRTSDPEALTGRLADIVAHVANVLAVFGERLKTGEVIIIGSITPPVLLEAGETAFAHALDPIGEVRVNFRRN